MIGNKTDLNEQRVVSKMDGEKLKNDYNLDLFVESSAKSGLNTEYIFVEAARVLYNDYVKYKIGNPLLGRAKSGRTKKLKQNDEFYLHPKPPKTAPQLSSVQTRSFSRVNWGFK